MGTFYTDVATSDDVTAANINSRFDEFDAALANLLDTSENLRGLVALTNKSGGALAAGDVVVVDTSNDTACTTTTGEGDTTVVGVVVTGGAADASVEVCVIGLATVTVDSSTSRGDFLKTATTAKEATPSSTLADGCFAIALTASASSVTAYLFGPSRGAATTTDVTVTAGENLAIRDAVYISTGAGAKTAGRAYKTDADDAYQSANAFVVGCTTEAISSAATGSVRICGKLGGFSGLTAGKPQYVSATAGAITESEPGNSWLVGIAVSTTEVLINSRGTQDSVSTAS